jgi:hypothetical protein
MGRTLERAIRGSVEQGLLTNPWRLTTSISARS